MITLHLAQTFLSSLLNGYTYCSIFPASQLYLARAHHMLNSNVGVEGSYKELKNKDNSLEEFIT